MKKGDTWAVEVTASDGALSSRSKREEARVSNTPPTTPRIKLTQDPTTAGTAALCGDRFSVRQWTPDQPTYRTSSSATTGPCAQDEKLSGIPPSSFGANDTLRVEVVALDGETASAPATVSAKVAAVPSKDVVAPKAAPAVPVVTSAKKSWKMKRFPLRPRAGTTRGITPGDLRVGRCSGTRRWRRQSRGHRQGWSGTRH